MGDSGQIINSAVSKILGPPLGIKIPSKMGAAAGFALPSFNQRSTSGSSWFSGSSGLSGLSAASAMPSFSGMPSFSAIPSFSGMPSFSSFSSFSAMPESAATGSYMLRVLFYMIMYSFIAFLILILVHYTIMPVFKFTQGSKGIISIPSNTDDMVYWNLKKQPPTEDSVPKEGDVLVSYAFKNNFSFSIDLYIRRITDTNSAYRVILFKTIEYGQGVGNAPGSSSMNLTEPTDGDLLTYMKDKCSMVLYLTETNNLALTFFSGVNGTYYSTKEIKNIPLYTPFRVTVTVGKKTFTIYINGKQAFQQVVPTEITLNTNGLTDSQQRFYSSPQFSNSPTKTVFVQNFHIWPREITLNEIQQALPALARKEDFGIGSEAGTDSCNV